MVKTPHEQNSINLSSPAIKLFTYTKISSALLYRFQNDNFPIMYYKIVKIIIE